FLLIDIRHEPSANDRQMYNWIIEQGYHPIIIATKMDKIKRSQLQKHIKMIKNGLEVVEDTIVIPFSAQTKQGREEIYELLDDMIEHFYEDDEEFAQSQE
ncbi:MAG: GTP-binding protein, partial [Lachnospiraceae bacterium]